MTPNKSEAQRHLSLLDNKATTFTFLTFDDDSDRRDRSLTKELHGSLDEHWDQLSALNLAGAGIFITVNETDGKGRKSENIKRIRALWVDDDGDGIKPDFSHFTVVTSLGKYHHYVLVDGLAPEEFEPYQQYMVEAFNSDPNAKDRARVLRLAGFYHQKANKTKGVVRIPFMVRLVESNENPPLDKSAISVPGEEKSNFIQPCEQLTDELAEELQSAIKHLDLGERALWIETGSALKSLGDAAFSIWHDRSAECQNYVDMNDCLITWNSLSSDRTNYKSIFAKAQRNGWVNPKSRLARGPEVFNASLSTPLPTTKIIHITDTPLDKRVQKAADSLAEMAPPTVFQRAQRLVEVISAGGTESSGIATIRQLKSAGLRVLLSEVATWLRGTSSKSTNPCEITVAGLLESPNKWKRIPQLAGLGDVPVLKPNGQLVNANGYDPDTGLYLTGSVPGLTVPNSPSSDEVKAASERLLEVFSEFPFVDHDQDKSVLLSYMMTMVIRAELPTAPMFAIDASTPGSGKDLLVNCANLVVRGRRPSIMPPVKGSAAEEETRKRITAMLSRGDSSVVLDNWTTPVGGESMNVLLTSEIWSDRILGSSETISLPTKVTLAATGNNLVMKGDMTRRSLTLRLSPNVERPELRNFKITGLETYVINNRAELISALFTIFRAYQLAGSPQVNSAALGSFEEWYRRIASCLLWLGYKNPIDSQDRLRNVDPDKALLNDLLSLLSVVYPNSVSFQVSDLSQIPPVATGEQGRLRTLISEIAPGTDGINRIRLGKQLNRFVDRMVDGLVLRRLDRAGSTNVSLSYMVCKANEVNDRATN
ncbi:MAG: PriCT-2 domain-containing protein [Gammaproteobacteria bacterium]